MQADESIVRLLDGLSSLIYGELELYQRVQFRRRKRKADREQCTTELDEKGGESEFPLRNYLHSPIVRTDRFALPTGKMNVVSSENRDIYFSAEIPISEEDRRNMRTLVDLDEAWAEKPAFPRSESIASIG